MLVHRNQFKRGWGTEVTGVLLSSDPILALLNKKQTFAGVAPGRKYRDLMSILSAFSPGAIYCHLDD